MSLKFTLNIKKFSQANEKLLDKGFFLRGTNGSDILLIHGLTGSPYEVGFVAKFLNRQGYSVTCPRLANHGGPIEILRDTPWPAFYQSVRDTFQQIKSRNPQGPIFVSGLSVGALFSLLLAYEFPQSTTGVSCLAPTVFYDGWNCTKWRFLLPLAYGTFLKKYFYFKEEPPYGIKNETIRGRVHEYYNQAKLEDTFQARQHGYAYYPVTLLYQHHLLNKHLVKKLSQIRTPVQLIQAYDDDMSSTRNSQFIYDRIQSEIKEIKMLYNSYHIITADQERETVAKEMTRFFDQLRSKFENKKKIP